MKIKFLGHACFWIEFGGKKLLFDPFITGNELANGFDISTLDPDYILLSHAHQDHVLDCEAIAKQSNATIISNYEITTHYSKLGLKGHPINQGGKAQFDFGTVKYVNAIHSSSFADETYGGNPGGFVIWNDDQCFYVAGDTALTMDMKIIPMTCPKLDVAILPIGDNFTMGYEEALIASDWVNCDQIVGCHFDTFGYIKIDHEKVLKAFTEKSKTLILPSFGQIIEI